MPRQLLVVALAALVLSPLLVTADTKGATKAFMKQKQTAPESAKMQKQSNNNNNNNNNNNQKEKSNTQQKEEQQNQQKHWSELYDDVGANIREEPHPDPNDEDHEGMIYVGRWKHTAEEDEADRTRLGFDVDNNIKYIFGTSLDETHKTTVEEHHLHPDHSDDYVWGLDSNDATNTEFGRSGSGSKSYQEALKDRRHKGISEEGPKPFGHFDTHTRDGGADPPQVVVVEPFFLDTSPITNEQFGSFVRATYYETEAEQFGWSYVLQSFLSKGYEPTDATTNIHTDPEAPEWVAVTGAYWRRPEGPHSSYKLREQHPVVHVSHRDAAEYCSWKGKRLAGEREWEAAARAGYWGPTNRTVYTWDTDTDDATPPQPHDYANLWGDGAFPNSNLAEDGWRGTSPVQTYPANRLGFYDMTGNVWEWMRGGKAKSRIVRGASYTDSVTGSEHQHAATLGARETLHGTTTAGNIGFRCAKAPQRRTEYHYVNHDEQLHGTLAVEDQFGRRDQVPLKGWEDQFDVIHDLDADANYDMQDDGEAPKRKKIVKKRERLMNEL